MTTGRSTAKPDPAKLRQIASQLKPGVVLRMYQPVAEKIKRHVLIAATADRSVAFVINTRPSPFIASRAELPCLDITMTLAQIYDGVEFLPPGVSEEDAPEYWPISSPA